MSRTFLRFLFKVGVALAVGAFVLFIASIVVPYLWSKYLGLSVGVAFSVMKAEKIFDRLWPEPKKGWAE